MEKKTQQENTQNYWIYYLCCICVRAYAWKCAEENIFLLLLKMSVSVRECVCVCVHEALCFFCFICIILLLLLFIFIASIFISLPFLCVLLFSQFCLSWCVCCCLVWRIRTHLDCVMSKNFVYLLNTNHIVDFCVVLFHFILLVFWNFSLYSTIRWFFFSLSLTTDFIFYQWKLKSLTPVNPVADWMLAHFG